LSATGKPEALSSLHGEFLVRFSRWVNRFLSSQKTRRLKALAQDSSNLELLRLRAIVSRKWLINNRMLLASCTTSPSP